MLSLTWEIISYTIAYCVAITATHPLRSILPRYGDTLLAKFVFDANGASIDTSESKTENKGATLLLSFVTRQMSKNTECLHISMDLLDR